MRILLGISALVLVAILWTAFSISRHIRLTRRRNRFLREQHAPLHDVDLDEPFTLAAAPPPPPPVSPLPARFAEPVALLPEPVADQPHLPASAAERKNPNPIEPPSAPSTFPGFARREIKREPASLPLPPLSPPIAQHVAAQPLRIMEFVPDPPPAPQPTLRRPVRSVPPPPRAAAVAAGKPAWDYFNKDMGDLSDPSPSRIRDRVRPR